MYGLFISKSSKTFGGCPWGRGRGWGLIFSETLVSYVYYQKRYPKNELKYYFPYLLHFQMYAWKQKFHVPTLYKMVKYRNSNASFGSLVLNKRPTPGWQNISNLMSEYPTIAKKHVLQISTFCISGTLNAEKNPQISKFQLVSSAAISPDIFSLQWKLLIITPSKLKTLNRQHTRLKYELLFTGKTRILN